MSRRNSGLSASWYQQPASLGGDHHDGRIKTSSFSPPANRSGKSRARFVDARIGEFSPERPAKSDGYRGRNCAGRVPRASAFSRNKKRKSFSAGTQSQENGRASSAVRCHASSALAAPCWIEIHRYCMTESRSALRHSGHIVTPAVIELLLVPFYVAARCRTIWICSARQESAVRCGR